MGLGELVKVKIKEVTSTQSFKDTERICCSKYGDCRQPTEQLVDAFRRPTASGVDSELEVKVHPSMPSEGDSSLPPGEHGHPIGDLT